MNIKASLELELMLLMYFHFFWMTWDALDQRATYWIVCLSTTVVGLCIIKRMLVLNAYVKV